MATNAYGQDFWVGRIFRSKDTRELLRHVVIADIKNGRAMCHTLIYGESGKMLSRGSWISLKGLASRWQTCSTENCFCKEQPK
jgi:hypothetical protein